jgi:nitrite reductase/ring-hydroxylating ferredoxin subunit
MKAVEVEGHEIVVCNVEGKFYAVERRCGHMNAPLDMGTLDGVIITCAMHCAQFDISTGEALSGPVPHDMGDEIPTPKVGKFLQDVGTLMTHVRTVSIHTFETRVEAGAVMVALALEE